MNNQRNPRRTERGPGVAPPPAEAGAAAILIRTARQRRSLSQAEVGRRTGFDQSLISRWERGRTEPSLAAVLSVLGACGFDIWAGLALVDAHSGRGGPAELHLLEENTPPDATGFRRIFRERDAEERQRRRDG